MLIGNKILVLKEQKINFADMSVKGIFILWSGIFLMLVFFPFNGFPQATGRNITASDTADYIPSWYPGALEYNLMIASAKGLANEIDRLIEMGANLNTYNEEGATPLIFAVSNNKAETVRALLKHSPRLDDITANSETALMIAVKNNYQEVTEMLLRDGAEIEFTDNHGATPLHYAALYGYFEMVDLLLYYDAAVDSKSDDGYTPLHTAIWAGYPDISDLLIQNGANMEARDNEGYTPFLIAASFGDTLIMDMLHNFGVDIYARNIYGQDALNLAIALNQKGAVIYLLENGTSWKEVSNKGPGPYTIASKYGRKEIAGILKKYQVPGNIKLLIDQASFSMASRFTSHDYYTAFSATFKEPYLNAGITAGLDVKLWYTRILIESSEKSFYQYYDKEAIIYAGLFKDFNLTDDIAGSNFILSASLSGGYSFGNKFKGTHIAPDNGFKIIPAVTIKWILNPVTVFTGMEYLQSEYYKIGPVWFRIGASYNYYFDNTRIRLKKIKWN